MRTEVEQATLVLLMPVVTLAWGIHTVRTGPLVQPTSVVTTPRANMLCGPKSNHELVRGGPLSDHSECKKERRVPPNIIASCHKPISAVSYKHQMPVPAGYTPSRSFAIHQASYVHAGIRVGDESQMTRSELAMLRNIFATYGNENCGGAGLAGVVKAIGQQQCHHSRRCHSC